MKKEISYCEICGLPKHRCYCIRDFYQYYYIWQKEEIGMKNYMDAGYTYPTYTGSDGNY